MNSEFELLNLLPGLIQGIVRVSISYPFDVIKTNIQKNTNENILYIIKHFVTNQPYRLYRGSLLSYISVGIDRSLQYYLLEKLNRLKYNTYLSSFMISLFSSIYMVPIQYLTTNIALIKETKFNTIDYIKNILNIKKNIFKGFFLENSKNLIGSTIFGGTYYALRNKFGENNNMSPFYGGISGLFTWCIIYPLDTIRTDLQTSNNKLVDIVHNRYKQDGIGSFYRGLSLTLFRTIPSATIGMYFYELTRNYISKYNKY
jgi:hypothetical protein